MGDIFNINTEQISQCGMNINIGCQCINLFCLNTRTGDHQRRVPHGFVLWHARLAPNIFFTKIMTMICTDDEEGVIPKIGVIHLFENLAEPVINHTEL